MIELYSKRLKICSNIELEDGRIVFRSPKDALDIYKITPTTGLENGFVAYIACNKVCHIGFQIKSGFLEISYGTNDKFKGEGYMSEMLPIVLDWFFKETLETCIYARVNKDNKYSIKLLEKNNFNQSDKYETGCLLYELTKNRWEIMSA